MNNHRVKVALLVILDLICMVIMSILALLIRFELDPDNAQFVFYLAVLLHNMPWMLLIKEVCLVIFGIYRSLWRYAGSDELLKVFVGCIVGNMAFLAYMAMTQQSLPRSFYIICTFLELRRSTRTWCSTVTPTCPTSAPTGRGSFSTPVPSPVPGAAPWRAAL